MFQRLRCAGRNKPLEGSVQFPRNQHAARPEFDVGPAGIERWWRHTIHVHKNKILTPSSRLDYWWEKNASRADRRCHHHDGWHAESQPNGVAVAGQRHEALPCAYVPVEEEARRAHGLIVLLLGSGLWHPVSPDPCASTLHPLQRPPPSGPGPGLAGGMKIEQHAHATPRKNPGGGPSMAFGSDTARRLQAARWLARHATTGTYTAAEVGTRYRRAGRRETLSATLTGTSSVRCRKHLLARR